MKKILIKMNQKVVGDTMEKELDMIELENGLKFAVLDAISYKDHTYLLLGKLKENMDDIDDDMVVYEKVDNQIVQVEDDYLLEQIIKTFENRIKANS